MFKRIFNGSVASCINIFVNLCVAVVQTGLVVRRLTPYEAGVWFVLLSIGSLIAYFDFGLGPTLSREIGFSSKKFNPKNRIANLYKTIKTTFLFIILSLTSVSVLAAIFYYYFLNLPSSVLFCFLFFVLGSAIRLQSNPHLALIYGLRYVDIERIIRCVAPLFGLLVTFLLLYFDYKLMAFSLGWCAQSLLLYTLARFFIYRKKMIAIKGVFLKVIIRRILEPCLQWSIMALGGFLIFQPANFFLAEIIDPSVVPQYSLLLQIISAIILVASLFLTVVIPFISKLYAINDKVQLEKLFFLTVKLSTAIAVTLAVFFYYYIQNVMKIWVGGTFFLNKTAFVILLFTVVLEVHHIAVAQMAMACGYVKFAKPSIIAGVLNIVLSIPLIKMYGVTGATIAVMLAQLCTNNWYSVFISLRFLQIDMKRFFKLAIFPIILYFVLILGFCRLFYLYIGEIANCYVALFLAVTCVGVIGFVFSFLILATNAQKKTIINIVFRRDLTW